VGSSTFKRHASLKFCFFPQIRGHRQAARTLVRSGRDFSGFPRELAVPAVQD
jgi:hypothetical protein